MTNWKTYRITEVFKDSWIGLNYYELDDYINYKDGRDKSIFLVNHPSYNTWEKGDYLEINLDETIFIEKGDKIMNNVKNVVRKVGSSAVVSSSSGGLTIPTTPSSAAEVARTVTQTVLDHADRTGGIPQIEIGMDKTSIRYYPPRK